MQVPQGGCSPGRCWPIAREDSSDGDEYGAPAGGCTSGRGENDADGVVHDLPNSLVDGFTGKVLGHGHLWGLLHNVGRMLSGVIRQNSRIQSTRALLSRCA